MRADTTRAACRAILRQYVCASCQSYQNLSRETVLSNSQTGIGQNPATIQSGGDENSAHENGSFSSRADGPGSTSDVPFAGPDIRSLTHHSSSTPHAGRLRHGCRQCCRPSVDCCSHGTCHRWGGMSPSRASSQAARWQAQSYEPSLALRPCPLALRAGPPESRP